MGRDWRQLVLAVAIAFAFAAAPVVVPGSEAQTVTKKKATKKQEEPAAEDAQAPPKKKKQDPAEAQKQIDAAQKLLESGKVDAAVQALTAVLSAGNLPPGLMARALYYRGAGQRQLQKPALAISDLTSALWLKGGLSEADRADALKQRTAAYSEAGLTDGSAQRVRTASVGDSNPGNAPAAQSASPGSWNLFGGLFGSTPSSPPPQPAPQPPPAKTASIAPGPSAGWSASTEVKPVPGSPAAVSHPAAAPTPLTPAAAPAPAPSAVPEGKFRVQLALVRSGDEADAIAARVRGDLASVFGPRGASVDQAVVGNMGTMYRVRVGPYANAGEGQAVCAKLKGSGLDCLVVSQ